MAAANEFANAIVSAGVRLGTPATVLSDGDAGLWKLQRQVMPKATLVLDWWHIAMRFEHALQAARGLAAGTVSAHLRDYPFASSKAPSGSFGMAVRVSAWALSETDELV
jgi:sugar phosphate isomerase/epimerase